MKFSGGKGLARVRTGLHKNQSPEPLTRGGSGFAGGSGLACPTGWTSSPGAVLLPFTPDADTSVRSPAPRCLLAWRGRVKGEEGAAASSTSPGTRRDKRSVNTKKWRLTERERERPAPRRVRAQRGWLSLGREIPTGNGSTQIGVSDRPIGRAQQ